MLFIFLIPVVSAIWIPPGASSHDVYSGIGGAEWQYDNVSFSGVINEVWLPYREGYFQGLAKYHLYINGVYVGNPFCADSGSGWCPVNFDRLIWRNIGLQADGIVLFECYTSGDNWHFLMDTLNVDSDGDGNQESYRTWDIYINGVFDGDLYSDVKDIFYRFNYTAAGGGSTQLTDTLTVQPDSVTENQSVKIVYSLETLGYQNYINISFGGSVIETYLPVANHGVYIFSNTSAIGSYTVNLTRVAVVEATDSFAVTKDDDNLPWVKITPNPCYRGDSIKIEAYYPYMAYDGFLRIGDDEFFLKSNNITTVYYDVSQSFNFDIDMFIRYNSSNEQVGVWVVYVKQGDASLSLFVNPTTVQYPKGVTFSGSHNFVGVNVQLAIYVGDMFLHSIDISYSQFFSEYWIPNPNYVGNHSVRLVVGSVAHATKYFLVSGSVGSDDIAEEVWGLPADYVLAMFGALITLGFLVIPFALAMKSGVSVSSVVYALFGGIGLGVATLAGLFPLWLPLMITILMVVIMVVEYKKGS